MRRCSRRREVRGIVVAAALAAVSVSVSTDGVAAVRAAASPPAILASSVAFASHAMKLKPFHAAGAAGGEARVRAARTLAQTPRGSGREKDAIFARVLRETPVTSALPGDSAAAMEGEGEYRARTRHTAITAGAPLRQQATP